MLDLAQNLVFRIDDDGAESFYRVVANDTQYPEVLVVKLVLAPADSAQVTENKTETIKAAKRPSARVVRMDREKLFDMHEMGGLQAVEVAVYPNAQRPLHALSDAEQRKSSERVRWMQFFLEPRTLQTALYGTGSLGVLVALTCKSFGCRRATVYRLWMQLCQYGFDAGSLNAEFSRCGAPGEKRHVGEARKTPLSGVENPFPPREKAGRKTNVQRLGVEAPVQPGTNSDWFAKVMAADKKIPNPKPSFDKRFQLILRSFSTGYEQTKDGVLKLPPARYTYPNRGQTRHILNQIPELKKIEQSVTAGHFKRNKRGLHGKTWEGVAGPGHTYAMDSTIGDVYLRSSINRAWVIGRPIVYFIVDVWSSAVVGFYVCLHGPSWETARLAIFCAVANPSLICSLWGYEPDSLGLDPAPGCPYALLVDRGEYLSAGATETGGFLGFEFAYTPSYRPDLKGIVEVLNRIAKDDQFFFVPGAIDARRKELELRPDPTNSAYTILDYVEYLAIMVQLRNFRPDMQHRLDTTMVGEGVHPSSAGLWHWGYEVGIGYRKHQTESKLITNLLPQYTGSIRRDGIFLGRLQYRNKIAEAEQWSTLARHSGRLDLPMHYFPGALGRAWAQHPQTMDLLDFTLSDEALAAPGTSMDEYLDACIYQSLKKGDHENETTIATFRALQRIEQVSRNARNLTRQAEEAHSGAKPTFTEARRAENNAFTTTADRAEPAATTAAKPQGDAGAGSNSAHYDELMRKMLGSIA